MSELLPCPSCGKAAGVLHYDSKIFAGQDYGERYPRKVATQTHGYQVRCEICGLQTCWWHYQEEAINHWNTRATDTQNQRLREALEEIAYAHGPLDAHSGRLKGLAADALKER